MTFEQHEGELLINLVIHFLVNYPLKGATYTDKKSLTDCLDPTVFLDCISTLLLCQPGKKM